jgi:hypothetical protein
LATLISGTCASWRMVGADTGATLQHNASSEQAVPSCHGRRLGKSGARFDKQSNCNSVVPQDDKRVSIQVNYVHQVNS